MPELIKGFNAVKVAQAFGIKNTLASEILKAQPINAENFIKNKGDLSSISKPISLQSSLNRRLSNLKENQSIKISKYFSLLNANYLNKLFFCISE